MSFTSQRLSDPELTQRILEMAKTGVYRQSIFDAFQSLATQRQIRAAIAQAKQFGLHSVRELRDAELGTYYQVEPRKYQSFQDALAASVALSPGDDLADRILQSTRAMRGMLAVAGSSAVVLLVLGGICLVTNHLQSGRMAWMGAASAAGIWLIQKGLARSLI